MAPQAKARAVLSGRVKKMSLSDKVENGVIRLDLLLSTWIPLSVSSPPEL